MDVIKHVYETPHLVIKLIYQYIELVFMIRWEGFDFNCVKERKLNFTHHKSHVLLKYACAIATSLTYL
jgi:hypothetical protein